MLYVHYWLRHKDHIIYRTKDKYNITEYVNVDNINEFRSNERTYRESTLLHSIHVQSHNHPCHLII